MLRKSSPHIEKPYHHGDLREALVAAGEVALAELPADQVSLREIARRAGVSHAAPKHHFAGMGELLAEIAARGFERFVQRLGEAADAANDPSPIGRLLAMGHAYLRFAAENPAVYGLMFGKKSQCSFNARLEHSAFAAWQQLESACAAITGHEQAQQAALLVWSTVHGLAMLQMEHRLPPAAMSETVSSQVLALMASALGQKS